MLGKVFKAYDIRATYPKPLNEKLAWQIGYGSARYFKEVATESGHDDPMMEHIVVGHDMRKSSPELSAALRQGIRDFGSHVINVGMVDTPFIYFAINHLGCCGGIQTTASHNPSNYNGFKISKIKAQPVGMGSGLDQVRRYAAMADRAKVTPEDGREGERDLWDAYRDHVHQFLAPSLIDGSKKLKVAVDASNGMAGTMFDKVFHGVAGLEVVRINFDNSTGEFVHEPNPLVEANLEQLRQELKASRADLGICFDGDADRCMVLDEQGRSIGCDLITAWLAGRFLSEEPGGVIAYDLRSSKSLPEMIAEAGGRPERSRVGHVFMKQKMADEDAVFGGELSGHFYFRDNFYADSGAIACAAVLSQLALCNGPMSAQIAPAQRYAQSGEINFENDDTEAAIEELMMAFPEAEIDELDGVTLDMPQWWCNVRRSNTEPLLRLNLEGPDQETVAERVDEVSAYLGKRVAH
jgi:phosphomannomutase